MGTYVTETGLIGKTQNEIIQELQEDHQVIFGNDIDLDSDSGFSQQIGIFSKKLVQLWDALAELYSCYDPNHATGICLDKISAITGITRLPATSTFVNNVLLRGTEGTLIEAGKKAKQTFNSINYSLTNNVTITKTIAAKGIISVSSVVVGTTYTVTINSVPYSYIAQAGNTKTIILNQIKTLIDAGTWTGGSTVASEKLTLLDLTNNFNFSITGNLNIDEIWSKGNFTADIAGVYTLAANSLIEIVTSVTGWNEVTNPEAGITGREIETDSELRVRRLQSILNGFATDEAIRSSIFNDVDGVSNVIVKSNRTDSVDSEGRDPHSFETVVEGGDNIDIAEKILEVQPAGIRSFGNTSETIPDSQGYSQIIKFSRPESVYIFLKVRRNFYNEEIYPNNGDALIKESIINWSLDPANITIGKDVIIQRISIPIYEVPGIKNIEVTIDSSKTLPYTPTYTANNISINDREKAVFSTDRILIQLLP